MARMVDSAASKATPPWLPWAVGGALVVVLVGGLGWRAAAESRRRAEMAQIMESGGGAVSVEPARAGRLRGSWGVPGDAGQQAPAADATPAPDTAGEGAAPAPPADGAPAGEAPATRAEGAQPTPAPAGDRPRGDDGERARERPAGDRAAGDRAAGERPAGGGAAGDAAARPRRPEGATPQAGARPGGGLGAGPGGGQGGGGGGGFLARMAEDLDLTAEQQSKWAALARENEAKLSALRERTDLSDEARRAQMRELRSAQMEAFDQLLTPAQRTKLAERRAAMRGAGPGAGPGGGAGMGQGGRGGWGGGGGAGGGGARPTN